MLRFTLDSMLHLKKAGEQIGLDNSKLLFDRISI